MWILPNSLDSGQFIKEKKNNLFLTVLDSWKFKAEGLHLEWGLHPGSSHAEGQKGTGHPQRPPCSSTPPWGLQSIAPAEPSLAPTLTKRQAGQKCRVV